MFAVFATLLASACVPAQEPGQKHGQKPDDAPVTVFAASSMTDALDEIATAYEHASGQTVRLSFAASGAIARQVQAGAPADVVILADETWMDRLQASDLLMPGSRSDLLRNRLVLIAAAGASTGTDPFDWLARTQGRLAIGDPYSVPAGAYARTWLMATHRWDTLQPQLVTATDVRAVRTFVERGEVALGVVYRSDTVGAHAVKIVGEPLSADQPSILYPAAATRSATAGATRFLAFMHGPEARRIFIARGFEPIA